MKTIIIDFETYYAKDYTLSSMTTQAYILDPRFKVHGAGIKIDDGPSKWVTAKYLPEVLKRLDLENNCLVGHNLHFDGAILAWKYGIIPKFYIDTLPMSRALVGVNSPRHGLTHIAKLLCGLEKHGGFLAESLGVRDLPPDMEHRVGEIYCAGPIDGDRAGDVMLTYKVLEKLLPRMEPEELRYIDWTIRIFTQGKVYMDAPMLESYVAKVRQIKQDALESVGLVDRSLLMSNPKYAEALQQLGATPPTKNNAQGKVVYAFAKTDEGHKALLEHDNPAVQALVAARLEVKSTIEETRAIKYLQAANFAVPWPVHINASGAMNTHRASGGDGGGGNPQNLKRGGTLRSAIMAPQGKTFIVPDLSQIEARITLLLGSGMPNANQELAALAKLANNEDIYSWFGSHIYGREISRDTPIERQVSKSACLGLGFGMGDTRFIDYCQATGIKSMTPNLAAQVKSLYRSMFSGVAQFWKFCQHSVLPAMVIDAPCTILCDIHGAPVVYTTRDPLFNCPAIQLPGGLQIKYPQLARGEGSGNWQYKDTQGTARLFGSKVMENLVQALAAKLLRDIIIEIKEPGIIDPWMSVHDEVPCLIDDTPEAKEYAIKRVMEVFLKPRDYLQGLPIGVEYGFAKRYGQAK